MNFFIRAISAGVIETREIDNISTRENLNNEATFSFFLK